MRPDLEVIREFGERQDEPRLRMNAYSALLALGDAQALDVFLELLCDERDVEVLKRVARSVELLEGETAVAVSRWLSTVADDPTRGPLITNLLARLSAAHPEAASAAPVPLGRGLVRAWRARRVPPGLRLPRRIRWRLGFEAFALSALAAAILGFSLRTRPGDPDQAVPILLLTLGVGLLAAFTAWVGTRGFHGVRFHQGRLTGALYEGVRTGLLAGLASGLLVWLVAAVEFPEIASMSPDLAPTLAYSFLALVVFIAAVRIGVALGAAAGSGSLATIAGRLVYPVAGGTALGLVAATALGVSFANSASVGVSTASGAWWFQFVSSSLGLGWAFAALEPSWLAPTRRRRILRAGLLGLVGLGALVLLLLIRPLSVVRAADGEPLRWPGPDALDTLVPLPGPSSRARLSLERPGVVSLTAEHRDSADIVLELWAASQRLPGRLMGIDRSVTSPETLQGVLRQGDYEVAVVPYGQLGSPGIFSAARSRLLGLYRGRGVEGSSATSLRVELTGELVREEHELTLGASTAYLEAILLANPDAPPSDTAYYHLHAVPAGTAMDSVLIAIAYLQVLQREQGVGQDLSPYASPDAFYLERALDTGPADSGGVKWERVDTMAGTRYLLPGGEYRVTAFPPSWAVQVHAWRLSEPGATLRVVEAPARCTYVRHLPARIRVAGAGRLVIEASSIRGTDLVLAVENDRGDPLVRADAEVSPPERATVSGDSLYTAVVTPFGTMPADDAIVVCAERDAGGS